MNNYKIAIVGLGYVGLPLAVAFAKKFSVVGFDIDKKKRIKELSEGIDLTLEVDKNALIEVLRLKSGVDSAVLNQSGNLEVLEAVALREEVGIDFSYNVDDIKECNVFIITVPTPIDIYKKPDLTPLKKASETVAQVLKKGDIVIYESTVYPGCTEEDCVPVLETMSGLKFNMDFYCGYSPERINPGDKAHTIDKIFKVTSGSTPEVGSIVDNIYKSIITAGTYLAPSIKVAESAKVIENAQRDINIAFVNELAKIFNLIGVDTHEVLKAAGTKWNFLPFKPGLVGGHCIGVDPYYLAQKSEEMGYYPEIILSGRRINDSMGEYVFKQVLKLMIKKGIAISQAEILVLGMTFKENCPDVRNTKVVDIIEAINEFGIKVDIYDPWADHKIVKHEYGLDILSSLPSKKYDAVILAVAHSDFEIMNYNSLVKEHSVIYDVKGVMDKKLIDGRL